MSLPRRGSRTIVVDDVPFRFMVSRRDPRQLALNVTIEHQDHPGKCLVASVDTRRLDAVGATEIGAFIRKGLNLGWRPALLGGNRPFRLTDEQIDDALVSVER